MIMFTYRFDCHGEVGKRIGVTLNTGQYLSLAEVEVMSTGEKGQNLHYSGLLDWNIY